MKALSFMAFDSNDLMGCSLDCSTVPDLLTIIFCQNNKLELLAVKQYQVAETSLLEYQMF
ncbi:hypothetical protein SLEP1_g57887 [Rubroshorea leprosula]|uniref:Uncharacterized protein n=1 Tax=Rubroshorea leprosula TaxID=152421 RepID=A0AAV5MMK6_9ROSI|nr:hypothetical protein SLEP1_g57887 [Rubroshorea leprosula]